MHPFFLPFVALLTCSLPAPSAAVPAWSDIFSALRPVYDDGGAADGDDGYFADEREDAGTARLGFVQVGTEMFLKVPKLSYKKKKCTKISFQSLAISRFLFFFSRFS